MQENLLISARGLLVEETRAWTQARVVSANRLAETACQPPVGSSPPLER